MAINQFKSDEGGGLFKLKSLMDIYNSVAPKGSKSSGGGVLGQVKDAASDVTGFDSLGEVGGALVNPMGGIGPAYKRIRRGAGTMV